MLGVPERPGHHPKLGVEIGNYLRDQIMSGQLRPGERILLDEVAGQLGVSRIPVRDAVLGLSHEGLVRVLPRRGVVVAPFTREDVADVYQVHAFISGLVAERAAGNIAPGDLEQLERLRWEMEAMPSEAADQREALNWSFHRIINRSAGSPKLLWLIEILVRNVPRSYYHLIPDWGATADPQHSMLLRALRDRDRGLARRLAQEHVQMGGTMLIEYLSRRGFWNGSETNPENA